jgi:MYXO-CTERM domain-containing protein
VLAAVMGCTILGRGPDPVTARPPTDPDRMPSDVLEKQDPGADTSKNPVLSRSEANPHPWISGLFGGCDQSSSWNGRETFIGCGSCSTRDASGAGSFMLVALAALVGTRRRRRRT